MSNDRIALERAILTLARQRREQGLRRVPFGDVLELTEVQEYNRKIPPASFYPDELCSCLTALSEDGLLNLHDIRFRQGADGYWAGGPSRPNASISITEKGIEWLTQWNNRKLSPTLSGGSEKDGSLLVSPTAFKIPPNRSHSEPGLLVAVMMPFKKEFDGVYETIESVCEKLGMTARKTDDMWEDQTIIQDIFTLLYVADIVVVDFSGSNPNVMYETGIAHLLGKRGYPVSAKHRKRRAVRYASP